MPSALSYPGVYIEEIPSGVRTISGVATSVTAFVGYTAKGPVNQARRIFNFGDFQRDFGGLHRDSEVSYAVQQFFMNGGGDAYVVRVAANSAAAGVRLKFGPGGADVSMTVEAKSPGAWGNLLRVYVTYDTADPANLFTLAVTRWDPEQGAAVDPEEFANLTLNSRSPRFAPAVVNAGSRLVKVTLAGGLPFARGYSGSKDLTGVNLAAGETRLRGRVDDEVDFDLTLSSPDAANTVAKKLTMVQNAIAASPVAARLDAARYDAAGNPAGGGNFIRIRSVAAADYSAVVITPAPASDASAALGFGVAAGGAEAGGAAPVRPTPSGTSSGPVTAAGAVGGNVTVDLALQTTAGTQALESKTVAVAAAPFGPVLRDNLQAAIRTMDHAAAKSAVVRIQGRSLQVTSSDAHPNVTFTLTGVADLQMPGAGPTLNVSRYSPGLGPTFAAQSGAQPGSDGTPPTAGDLKGDFGAKTGIYALREVDLFNILCIPATGVLTGNAAAVNALVQEAAKFCEDERAFYIVDPPASVDAPADVEAWLTTVTSRNAAVYYPRISVADPLREFRVREMPASGAVAGVFARTDATRGVWKAPAGTEAVLRGTQGLARVLTDPENGVLNKKGVNVLRTFPVYGSVVWGARTRAGDDDRGDEYKYVPVRRLALYIEETLFRSSQWVVFEPNDEPLWAQIRLNVGAFMHGLFRQGAFQGSTPAKAYLVKCDSETTTQYDIDRGIVNILVAFAPLKPAEFVVIRIQQKAQIPA